MGWILHAHSDGRRLAGAVSVALEEACRAGLAARGAALLALAGGRAPWPAYARLAACDLDWTRVAVLPTDERCVPHAHPASNSRGLAEAFAAAAARGDAAVDAVGPALPGLTVPDGAPEASLAHARALLAANPQPFDAVLLGMGGDGHFASLFPGAANLDEGFDPALDACRIDPVPLPPEAPYPRISLTLPRLLRTRTLLLAVTGAGKRAVLEEAMAGADPRRLPVAALLHAPGAQLHVHWSP